MKIRTAPRRIMCNTECPNWLKELPLAIICQNPACPNYWLMQAWLDVMEKLDKEFPFQSNSNTK
jgi:hypothetical protein